MIESERKVLGTKKTVLHPTNSHKSLQKKINNSTSRASQSNTRAKETRSNLSDRKYSNNQDGRDTLPKLNEPKIVGSINRAVPPIGDVKILSSSPPTLGIKAPSISNNPGAYGLVSSKQSRTLIPIKSASGGHPQLANPNSNVYKNLYKSSTTKPGAASQYNSNQ